MVWLLAATLVMGGLSPRQTTTQHGTYPPVQPFTERVDVPNVTKADVVVLIKDTEGAPAYRLQCHSAGWFADRDFDYTGEFECRLSSASGHDDYTTLLTWDAQEKQDWESRGRFMGFQLRPPCSAIPEFGATRHFRLRRMELTLRIVAPTFTPESELQSLGLIISVRPDSTAKREIAGPVPIPGSPLAARCRVGIYFGRQATNTAHGERSAHSHGLTFHLIGMGEAQVDGRIVPVTGFKASDGTGLTAYDPSFKSETEAAEFFDFRLAKAKRVVRLGIKKNSLNEVIGERAQVIYADPGGSALPAVLWTDGRVFHEIDSNSLPLILKVEKALTPP